MFETEATVPQSTLEIPLTVSMHKHVHTYTLLILCTEHMGC